MTLPSGARSRFPPSSRRVVRLKRSSRESAFIDSPARAGDAIPRARGLARRRGGARRSAGETLVLTHDMLVEGVHFLPDDPPADVAWKLVAVNLSDLAAKGARAARRAARLSRSATTPGTRPSPRASARRSRRLRRAPARRRHRRAAGRRAARARPDRDRRAPPARCPREAARGRATCSGSPARSAMPAPAWRMLRGGADEPAGTARAYRRPRPRLEAGQRLAPLVAAMMDVSDGLLLDAARMARGERLRGARSSSTRCRCPTPFSRFAATSATPDSPPRPPATITNCCSPRRRRAAHGVLRAGRARSGFPCRASATSPSGAGLTLTDWRACPARRLGFAHGEELGFGQQRLKPARLPP